MGTIVVAALLFGRIKELMDYRLADRERPSASSRSRSPCQRATLGSTADGILVVDRKGDIVSFNRRFKEMWHLPDDIVESWDGERAIAFVCDQLRDPTTFVRKINQLYKRPEAESFDMLQFKDDRVFDPYSRPQRGNDGEIHGRVWSFRDVTEREPTSPTRRSSGGSWTCPQLGKATIAEFAPDGETIELLRDYGVSFAQGYPHRTPSGRRRAPGGDRERRSHLVVELSRPPRGTASYWPLAPWTASIQSQRCPHSWVAWLAGKYEIFVSAAS